MLAISAVAWSAAIAASNLLILNASGKPLFSLVFSLHASEDGSECDGWRRELGADEVCESYMDAE